MTIHEQIIQEANNISEQVIAWRRDIHAHPEMSNMEFRTSKLVAAHLKSLNFDEVYEGLAGGTGVIGILHGAQDGPTVGMRFDMDAQAVKETTGLPFASTQTCQWGGETVPVMHCCGHDVHTSMGMATAVILTHLKDKLHGKVMFVFQPAEEGPSPGWTGRHGADAIMHEKVFEENKPAAMFTLHIDPNQPIGTAGELAFMPGQTCMAISSFSIELEGVGGHNAKPWVGIDTLLPGAQILQGLQNIVTRNVNPNTNQVVLTVGQFLGGTKYNVIADHTVLRGACRFTDYSTRAYLENRVAEVVSGIAAAGNVKSKLTWDMHYPPNFNNAELMKKVVPQLEKTLGQGRVTSAKERCAQFPDDFSYYTLQIPSIYAMLSCAPDSGDPKKVAGLHTANLMVNEKCILEGVKAASTFALCYAGEDEDSKE